MLRLCHLDIAGWLPSSPRLLSVNQPGATGIKTKLYEWLRQS